MPGYEVDQPGPVPSSGIVVEPGTPRGTPVGGIPVDAKGMSGFVDPEGHGAGRASGAEAPVDVPHTGHTAIEGTSIVLQVVHRIVKGMSLSTIDSRPRNYVRRTRLM